MKDTVLVTVDSLRADHLGCYGYDRDTSPFLDRLAEDGDAFDCYANANWTRMSFPGILTSTYAFEHGGFEYLSDSRTPVAEVFRENGYMTGGFHSAGWLAADFNYDRGFDEFYDSKSEPSLGARLRHFVKHNLDHDSRLYGILEKLYNTTERKAGVDIGQAYKDADEINRRAVNWLEGLEDTRFFLWVHYMDVHHPYLPKQQELDELGIDHDISEREAIRLRRRMTDAQDEGRQLPDSDVEKLIDLYDGEIRYTDRKIEELYEAVNEMSDDFEFVVTSDHGEEFGEHGGYSHNDSMYDEILHVPMVVSKSPDQGFDGQVELLDTSPTACDLAGIDKPEEYRGKSVLEKVRNGETTMVVSEANKPEDSYKLSLRAEGYKFIWDEYAGTEELYNLEEDPGETENIVDRLPEKVNEFQNILREHMDTVSASNQELPEIEISGELESRLEDLGYL